MDDEFRKAFGRFNGRQIQAFWTTDDIALFYQWLAGCRPLIKIILFLETQG